MTRSVGNLRKRLDTLETELDALDWRTYARWHGLAEAEVVAEAMRMLIHGEVPGIDEATAQETLREFRRGEAPGVDKTTAREALRLFQEGEKIDDTPNI